MDRLLTKLKNKEYPDTYDNNLQKLNYRSDHYFEINRDTKKQRKTTNLKKMLQKR